VKHTRDKPTPNGNFFSQAPPGAAGRRGGGRAHQKHNILPPQRVSFREPVFPPLQLSPAPPHTSPPRWAGGGVSHNRRPRFRPSDKNQVFWGRPAPPPPPAAMSLLGSLPNSHLFMGRSLCPRQGRSYRSIRFHMPSLICLFLFPREYHRYNKELANTPAPEQPVHPPPRATIPSQVTSARPHPPSQPSPPPLTNSAPPPSPPPPARGAQDVRQPPGKISPPLQLSRRPHRLPPQMGGGPPEGKNRSEQRIDVFLCRFQVRLVGGRVARVGGGGGGQGGFFLTFSVLLPLGPPKQAPPAFGSD